MCVIEEECWSITTTCTQIAVSSVRKGKQQAHDFSGKATVFIAFPFRARSPEKSTFYEYRKVSSQVVDTTDDPHKVQNQYSSIQCVKNNQIQFQF